MTQPTTARVYDSSSRRNYELPQAEQIAIGRNNCGSRASFAPRQNNNVRILATDEICPIRAAFIDECIKKLDARRGPKYITGG